MRPLEPGAVVAGRYRILATLGEGAMGVVYRAEQLDSAGQAIRQVALKMVQPGLSDDTSFAVRFRREAQITMSLRSPYLVTVHDTGETSDGQLYFSMELVAGGTLQELLRREAPLPLERTIEMLGQICDALAEAHGQAEPIVHRDLKPANIFVETQHGRDWVKIADFGIAKVLGEESTAITQKGFSLGTPRYMAPEQWRGEDIGPRSDLYSVGVIAYEMLSGKPPFVGSAQTLMYQHLNEPPAALPATLPDALRGLVASLLEKDANRRPADAETVRRALTAASRGVDPGASGSFRDQATEKLPSATADDMAAATERIATGEEAVAAVTERVPSGGPTGDGAVVAAPQRSSKLPIALAVVLIAGTAGASWVFRESLFSSPSSPRIEPPAVATLVPPTRAPVPTVGEPLAAPPPSAVASRPPSTATVALAPTPTATSTRTVAPTATVVPTATRPVPTRVPPTSAPVVVAPRDCNAEAIARSDVERWLADYEAALEAKDVSRLQTIGAIRSDAEARRQRKLLAGRERYEVDIEDLEVQLQGATADLAFLRVDSYRDAKLPVTTYDQEFERRRLGRERCRVVAIAATSR